MSRDRDNVPHPSFVGPLPVTRAALEFAERRHAGQRRPSDGAPFVVHALEVAALLDRAGYPDRVVAAAVLHDVLEHSDAERSEVEALFGSELAELVTAVSDDPTIADEEERKEELRARVRRAGGYATAVYAADKISKARELHALIAGGLSSQETSLRWERLRRALAMLDEAIPGSRLVELLRFEVETLDALPTGRSGR
jgi:(p)ppGpp synthase/HD superfamily hydrolase